METTLNWLREYVDLEGLTVDEVEHRLTMSGTEVEHVVKVADVGEDAEGDVAMKMEITSNRTDCYGMLGLARELAALTGGAFTLPDTEYKPSKNKAADVSSVEIAEADRDLCPYYTAQVITGVKVSPSPKWLLDRINALAAVTSIRPVNNVVDLTNFVLFETGQPLHAFDLDKLAGKRVIIRRAKKGEKIRAIDDVEYALDETMCVIADEKSPQCVGGVMGGKHSEITEATTSILLESAYFNPLNNRETSRKLSLHSDSSYRFSRGVDPAGVLLAQRRCAKLIAEVCGGEILDGILADGEIEVPEYKARLRLDRIKALLGIEIAPQRCIEILEKLGLKVKSKPNVLEVTSPSARRDLTREVDLIEEIGRIHGYDHVPTKTSLVARAAPPTHREKVEARLRQALVGAGYDETITDTFVPDKPAFALSPWADSNAITKGAYRVTNPIRKGEGLCRVSAIQSLLVTKKRAQDQGETSPHLFELGRIYLPAADGASVAETKHESAKMPHELRVLTLLGPDLHTIKGTVEHVLATLSIEYKLEPAPADAPLVDANAAVRLCDTKGKPLGIIGDVKRATLTEFELQTAATVAELDLVRLIELATFERRFQDLPRFPGMSREFAMILDDAVAWADLAATITKTATGKKNLFDGATIFAGLRFLTEYRGKPVPAGKKQYTFEVRFQHPDRTLTTDEVNTLQTKLVAACEKAHAAQLRG